MTAKKQPAPPGEASADAWRSEAAGLLDLASLATLDVERLAACIALRPPSAEVLVYLVTLAAERGLSQRQRKAAESKNAKARAWVLAQWEARPDLYEGKASFSGRITPLVVDRFGASPAPEWIAKKWLPNSSAKADERALNGKETDERPVAWTGRPHFKR
jgi:hypothetical protein